MRAARRPTLGGESRLRVQAQPSIESTRRLVTIKVVHTIVWAFFAGCIFWIPVLAWQSNYMRAGIVIAVVLVEVIILVMNGWQCPLTGMAAPHTTNRRANFDIFLPVWLAHYNKAIFGTLYVAGIVLTVAKWRGWLR